MLQLKLSTAMYCLGKKNAIQYISLYLFAIAGEIIIDITTYKASEDNVITVTHKIVYDEAKYKAFSQGEILIESLCFCSLLKWE